MGGGCLCQPGLAKSPKSQLQPSRAGTLATPSRTRHAGGAVGEPAGAARGAQHNQRHLAVHPHKALGHGGLGRGAAAAGRGSGLSVVLLLRVCHAAVKHSMSTAWAEVQAAWRSGPHQRARCTTAAGPAVASAGDARGGPPPSRHSVHPPSGAPSLLRHLPAAATRGWAPARSRRWPAPQAGLQSAGRAGSGRQGTAGDCMHVWEGLSPSAAG